MWIISSASFTLIGLIIWLRKRPHATNAEKFAESYWTQDYPVFG